MRIGYITDTHLTDRAPRSRVDDYRAALIAKLETVGELIVDMEIDTLYHGGDLFHEKRANRVRYSLTGEVIDIFNSYRCPVFIVSGNHDQNPGGIETINDQPIALVDRAPNSGLLTTQMLPMGGYWVAPRPYNAAREIDPEYYRLTLDERQSAQDAPAPVIMIAHGPLLPPGDSRPYPFLPIDEVDTGGIDLILAGHIHEPLGQHTLDDGTIFANPGSICRVSRTQSNLLRTPQMYVIAIEDGKISNIEEVPIPGVAPGIEVFAGSAEEEELESVNDDIQQFVRIMDELPATDELPLEDIIEASNQDSDVQRLLVQLLEEANV